MNYFLDSSAFTKIFIPESGTARVETIVYSTTNTVWISELALVEFRSALFRRVRMQEITLTDAATALQSLSASLFRFEVIDLIGSHLIRAASLIEQFGTQHALRTLDSLQLASFLSQAQPDWWFVTSDQGFARIVRLMGYQVLDPTI